ncbi:hypothetical protein ACK1O1_04195 [Stenotrophomonas maltophilia]|uniref:hypothetical protein n=1 Tax=Stenotrophomonas maltophilia TaxID=40324 RepID=UPI0039174128
MSDDNKTLADARPGGRVRLGDGLLPCPFCGKSLTINGAGDGVHPRDSDCILAQHVVVADHARHAAAWNRRALSAHPSPSGQGDALALADQLRAIAEGEHSTSQNAADDTGYLPSDVIDTLNRAAAALAARQPVGEPVDDDAASEAFGEFADDYLTDGNGYAPASTHEACSKAFTAAWPDRVAATAAARSELKRLHGDDRTVGARRAEALNRAAARDDAEDDPAPPAQAVDLADFKALYRAYVRLLESGRDRIRDLGGACDPVDVMEANDVDLRAARRVIDSQAVGNG